MFTLRASIGGGKLYPIGGDSVLGGFLGPAIWVPNTGNSDLVRRFGFKPKNSGKFDEINILKDRSCEHLNISGDVYVNNAAAISNPVVIDKPAGDGVTYIYPASRHYGGRNSKTTNPGMAYWFGVSQSGTKRIVIQKYAVWETGHPKEWRYLSYRSWWAYDRVAKRIQYLRENYRDSLESSQDGAIMSRSRTFIDLSGAVAYSYTKSFDYSTPFEFPASWPEQVVWQVYYPVVANGIDATQATELIADTSRLVKIKAQKIRTDFIVGDDQHPWDEVAMQAAENMQLVAINALAYVRDLKMLFSTVSDLYKLAKGNVTPETLSKAWLAFRYGLRLTMKDSTSLGEGIARYISKTKYKRQIVRVSATRNHTFRGSNYVCQYHYKVLYKSSSAVFLKCMKALYDWDIALSLENVWDLVPFTFVVDWIINVGDSLDYLDKINYLNCVDVLAVTRSVRSNDVPLDLGEVPFGLSARYYKREARRKLDKVAIPSLFPDSLRTINIIDGISLIISSLSK